MIARLISVVLWLVAAGVLVVAESEPNRELALLAWALAVLLTTLAVAAWKDGER